MDMGLNEQHVQGVVLVIKWKKVCYFDIEPILFYSEYSLDKEDGKTCSLVSAVIHGGLSLGAAVSPTLFGGLSEVYSYTTLVNFVIVTMLCMVSYSDCVLDCCDSSTFEFAVIRFVRRSLMH